MSTVHVKDQDSLPMPIDKPLLRPHQMVAHQKDLEQCQQDLKNTDIKQKGVVRQRLQRLEKQYADQAPRPITDPIVRDKVAKRIKDLEDQIRVGLPSAEEMRKATNATVEQHRRWERANKPKINEWRNLSRQLNTDTSDPDTHDRSLGDIEKLRPMSAQDRLRTDGFIGGAMTYGSVPQENWDQVFQQEPNSALKQAQKASIESVLKMPKIIPAEKPKRVLTPEQRAKKAEILAAARAKRKSVIAKQASNEVPVESVEQVVPADGE